MPLNLIPRWPAGGCPLPCPCPAAGGQEVPGTGELGCCPLLLGHCFWQGAESTAWLSWAIRHCWGPSPRETDSFPHCSHEHAGSPERPTWELCWLLFFFLPEEPIRNLCFGGRLESPTQLSAGRRTFQIGSNPTSPSLYLIKSKFRRA